MGLPEIVQVAREISVMVRVQGPDPKGLKMRNHAFHQYQSGITTLSASGMLVSKGLYNVGLAIRALGDDNQSGALVVTVASVVEPFLSLWHRENNSKGHPELISGAQIDILVENTMGAEDTEGLDREVPCWLSAQLLTLVDVPGSSLALQALVEASSGLLGHGWEIGWSLASNDSSAQNFTGIQSQRPMALEESANPSFIGKSLTKFAVLGVPLFSQNLPNITVSPSIKRGDFLLAAGSPFGIHSPAHFINSISVGTIANICPPGSPDKSFLMADIRCLPGMEGGPILDKNADLIGILIRPLRQKASGAEVQLLVPWEAIATARAYMLPEELKKAGLRNCHNLGNPNNQGKAFIYNSDLKGPINSIVKDPSCPSSATLEKAMASVCLVSVNDAAWASGILLNSEGLIMTNAHLLEPWRFGKATLSGKENGIKSGCPRPSGRNTKQGSEDMGPSISGFGGCFTEDKFAKYSSSSLYSGHKNIRIRLNHTRPWIWCDAKVVYISSGPLDVALLQLIHAPNQLSPVIVDFASPPLGSKAYVIGHGLFGPRCGLFPSVSVGVVAKVVKAKRSCFSLSVIKEYAGDIPAMLETTAAVHPGASGGLVVNFGGCMIGLITSNARRHGGGTVIPHLNFSIPCAALAPIFKFSQDMRDPTVLQDLDQPNAEISSIWALMPSLAPKPHPALPHSTPQDKMKEGKGSRFAKFISDTDIFKSSTGDSKPGKLPLENVLSKL
ncbi:glyoxysomal processing protease, glyoxysomal [Rhodamnia argentea]|uniref:Glyoxysomal processing protease, glyoxysomal n=1 Tax=Rhodamnia argentea TaxID=178133 RepID=A0A8B8QAK7_9MYRT|nr:glyoxysomal processing protease, glyoxysomal [Rhodamnia argentea]